MTIRSATEDDQHAITRLVHDARLDPNGLDWRRFTVADEGGRIVGCAQLKIHRHGTRELHLLAVEPERRGAGIGSRLVEALLEQEIGERTRRPGLLWAPRGAQYHRALAGAGRRSRAQAPERNETRHQMTADDDSIVEPAPGEATDIGAAEAEPDDLIGELARAMHVAAGSQRLRIAEELDRQRAAEIGALKARAGSEAKALKKTSEQDIGEIETWAQTATELIAAERVRRIDARRARLQAELVRHDGIVELEVKAVEAAVEAHKVELDTFFSQLEGEADPAGIARLASSMPSHPSLSDAADVARRQATAESGVPDVPADHADLTDATTDFTTDGAVEVSASRLMAVMAPAASDGSVVDAARPWEAVPSAVAVPAGVGAATADANGSTEPMSEVSDGARPLLHAIPSTRPMDRLRSWNRTPDDDQAPED